MGIGFKREGSWMIDLRMLIVLLSSKRDDYLTIHNLNSFFNIIENIKKKEKQESQ